MTEDKHRNPVRRRFIAGAVCPQCRETDRLVVVTEDDTTRRECVACGYTDTQPVSGGGSVPRGRPEKARVDDAPRVLNIRDLTDPEG